MGNSCTSQKKFRFKNLVIAVYPDNPNDGPVKDALDRLESYLASNPERIPRVCRKISKLLSVHLRRRQMWRVLVGAQTLRHLIAHSDDVSGFVPHSIDICAALLPHHTMQCRIAAANVLATLCRKVAGRPEGEQSRRLLADSKDRLLPGLEGMCVDQTEGAARMRLAALVAIGSAAHCLHGALCDVAERLVAPPLQCLARALQARPLPCSSAAWRAPGDCGDLPAPAADPAADVGAMAFAVGAVAGCVSVAGAQCFLRRVEALVDVRGVWAPSALPCMAFWSVTRAMEARPQRLGFVVCQFLCHAVEHASSAAVRIGALRALTMCVGEVPMTGGRTQVLCDLAQHAMTVVPCTEETVQAVLDLFHTLARNAHHSRNAPQLHCVLVGLLEQLQKAEKEKADAIVLLTLRALAYTVPYVRTFPIAQRGKLNVMGVMEPYLGRRDEQQTWAARVLVALLAGSPSATEPTGEADDESCGIPDKREDNAEVLETDTHDIMSAEQWVLATIADTAWGATPCCVIEVGRVVTAVMESHGVRALPFVITVLATLQAAVESTGPNGSLHLAWAHLSLPVLANCGVVYGMPELTKHAMFILQERREANPRQLAPQFCSTFLTKPSGIVALQLTTDCNSHAVMNGDPRDTPAVTSLILFDKLIDAVLESAAASPEMWATFGIAPGEDLRGAIAEMCFSPGAALSTARLSLAQQQEQQQQRARPRLPQPFTLTPSKPRTSAASPGVHVILCADAGSGEAVKEGAAVQSCVSDILARYGVSSATELLSSEKHVEPLPLSKLLSASPPPTMHVSEPVSKDRLLPNKPCINLYENLRVDNDNLYRGGHVGMKNTNGVQLHAHACQGFRDNEPNQVASAKKSAVVPWGRVLPASKYMDIF